MKLALLMALAAGGTLFAQMQNNTEKSLTCQFNLGNDRAHHCDIREQSVPGVGRLNVEVDNGSATVKGWMRSDVLVRSRVEASADSQSAADAMASQVMVDSSSGQVRATGPESRNNSGWSISYEVFVPQNTDLELHSTNGALAVSDVKGQLHFEVINGAVHLKRVAGDLKGTTTNGAIQLDLMGPTWEGNQVELHTSNGGITLGVPANYSAHFQTETGLGSVQSEFPVTTSGNLKEHRQEFSLGAGGPLIHIVTGNGSIKLKHAESQ